jgi:uncharacterized protein
MIRDEPTLASPTAETGRIEALDALRGLALLGMLIVHFHERTIEMGGLNDVVRTLVWRLVETKSHGTFALLFGAGFAIQLRRATARGARFTGLYVRRLAVLAVFGFAAHALFGFNVLLGYAVWGVPLLLIRNWSTRALLVTALLSVLSVSVFGLARDSYLHWTAGPGAAAAAADARSAEALAGIGALHTAEAQASYAALVRARLRHMAWFHAQPFFFLPNVTLALFIAGLLLVRHRVFEHARAHLRLLGVLAAGGTISWLADDWLLPAAGFSSAGLLRDQWLMFAYVSAALYLFGNPSVLRSLRPAATAGRMALTNYLMQIAALDLLFSGYGAGLGTIRPVAGFAAAIGAFVVQTAISVGWLARYQYGPAEWLWRSITYKRWQPMRRPAAARAATLTT